MEMKHDPRYSPAVDIQRFARAFEDSGLIGIGK
jgi:hypothetical protein